MGRWVSRRGFFTELAEVVRVAGVAPQAAVHHLTAMGRIGLEARELPSASVSDTIPAAASAVPIASSRLSGAGEAIAPISGVEAIHAD